MKPLVILVLTLCAATALPRYHKAYPERIVGGTEASAGEFPHIVQLMRNGAHYCGGSIVNADYIVTAAHCATGAANSYTIVAGEHRLDQTDGTEQSRSVAQVVRHAFYNPFTFANDIAIMKLSSPFTLNDNVKAATIPSTGFTPANDLVAAGWGTLSSGGSLPNILMKVTVPHVPTDECKSLYGSSQILPGMLCAGIVGKDSCQGDSGGPLMSGSTLVGITSWGQGCALENYPGVYTSVSYFSNWISQRTR